MGYLSFTTAKVNKAIQIQSIARAGDGTVTVYVQNVGDSPVKLANVYADGELNVGASSDPAFGSELADKDTKQVMNIIESLEEIDDVQQVYSGLHISDEVMAEMAA